MKPDVKEFCQDGKKCQSSQYFFFDFAFGFGNTWGFKYMGILLLFFTKNVMFICDGHKIVTLQLINE
jgi:hypothetical protein